MRPTPATIQPEFNKSDLKKIVSLFPPAYRIRFEFWNVRSGVSGELICSVSRLPKYPNIQLIV
jgi:hypothetical protein